MCSSVCHLLIYLIIFFPNNYLNSIIPVSKVSCSGYLSPPGYWYESVALDIWKLACRHVSKFARTVFLHGPFVSVVLQQNRYAHYSNLFQAGSFRYKHWVHPPNRTPDGRLLRDSHLDLKIETLKENSHLILNLDSQFCCENSHSHSQLSFSNSQKFETST